jgi:hypothetical protein
MTGAELIAAERERQVREEAWSPADDAGWTDGQLAAAADAYIRDLWGQDGKYAGDAPFPRDDPPDDWPWAGVWWKPTPDDPVRQLTKAGALIAAEIDRLQGEGE